VDPVIALFLLLADPWLVRARAAAMLVSRVALALFVAHASTVTPSPSSPPDPSSRACYTRLAVGRILIGAYTLSVRQASERAVVARIPTILDQSLGVIRRRAPLSVTPGTSLADCVAQIQRSGVGDSVIVVDDEARLVGVLTERDVFGRLIGTGVDLRRPVEELMTTEPRTLRPEQTVSDAMELMQTGRYRNIPLVDDDRRVVGVVRQQDVLRYLAESFPEELLNLPPRPHQTMEETEGA
jgi:CBS domain-containing protein